MTQSLNIEPTQCRIANGFANCEPTLSEMLADPIFKLLMARDHVSRQDLQSVVDRAREVACQDGR